VISDKIYSRSFLKGRTYTLFVKNGVSAFVKSLTFRTKIPQWITEGHFGKVRANQSTYTIYTLRFIIKTVFEQLIRTFLVFSMYIIRSVLPYARFCNCLLDYDYVLHIVNFAILYSKLWNLPTNQGGKKTYLPTRGKKKQNCLCMLYGHNLIYFIYQ
jgi:hypothetical protein